MSATGWWKFERLYTDSFAGVTDIDYSGRFVWAVAGGNLRVYDVYDLEQYLDEIDSFVIEEPNRGLTVFETFSLPGAGYYLEIANGTAYVSAGSTFASIYEVKTNGDIETISAPDTMQSNIHHYDGKLWMVGSTLIDDEHSLFSYDLSTGEWDSVIIPVRKQLSVAFFVHDDKAGNVLVTNFNNLSVAKFDAGANTHTSTIRLDDGTGANRGPRRIYTDSSLTTWVASINGMISTVDTSTDTVSHELNSFTTAEGICSDGTYLWFAANDLVRSRESDGDIRMTNGDEDDYSFNTERFPSTTFTALTKTIAHSYATDSGTQTVGEYIFLTTATDVIAFRNDDLYYRTPYTKIQGVGMVSSGKHDYTGD